LPSGVIVVDDANVVVGVITERDCIAAATSADYYGEWGGPAGMYMSSPVEYVNPDDNLVDVADRMAKSTVRRYPVIDDGRLVGLIARRDVMRALGAGAVWTLTSA
jgi:CBS domain-containing protein